MGSPVGVGACELCGREFKRAKTGRRRMYCSNVCKQRAFAGPSNKRSRGYRLADELWRDHLLRESRFCAKHSGQLRQGVFEGPCSTEEWLDGRGRTVQCDVLVEPARARVYLDYLAAAKERR